MSCSGAPARQLTAKATGAQPTQESATDDTQDEDNAEVSSQGGSTGDDGTSEQGSEDESAKDTEPNPDSDSAGNLFEKSPPSSGALYQQLSRHKYSEFEPTEDMLDKTLAGFYKLENSVYLPDRSTGFRSEKAEIIEAWFQMPADSDYREIVKAYSGNLEEGFAQQEINTENGTTAYFVTHDENKMWSKVISIWKYPEKDNIEIHIMFNRKFK